MLNFSTKTLDQSRTAIDAFFAKVASTGMNRLCEDQIPTLLSEIGFASEKPVQAELDLPVEAPVAKSKTGRVIFDGNTLLRDNMRTDEVIFAMRDFCRLHGIHEICVLYPINEVADARGLPREKSISSSAAKFDHGYSRREGSEHIFSVSRFRNNKKVIKE